ncbi:MAG: nuclear transport factor 2 family protein [Balneola sp.]
MVVKNVLMLVLALSSLMFCGQQDIKLSESEKNRIKTEVKKSFESLVESTKKQDWDSYFDHFDQKNFTGLNADGTVWESFEEFKESVHPVFQMIESSDSLEFTNVKITALDHNTAILINQYKQKIVLNGGQEIRAAGGGTQVWSKVSDNWKLVSISSSSKE